MQGVSKHVFRHVFGYVCRHVRRHVQRLAWVRCKVLSFLNGQHSLEVSAHLVDDVGMLLRDTDSNVRDAALSFFAWLPAGILDAHDS